MKKFMMGRTLVLTLALLLMVGSITGGTIAWFTDSVTSAKNEIKAGNLDLEIYLADGTQVKEDTSVFNLPELWEPGAVATSVLTVKNAGNLALKYDMNVTVTDENKVNVPEGYKLSDVLKIAFVDGEKTYTKDAAGRAAAIADAKAKGTSFFDFTTAGQLLADAEAKGTMIVYWEPTANDNNWNLNNGKTTTDGKPLFVNLGLTANAIQLASEADSFDNQYDANTTVTVAYDASKTPAENGKAVDDALRSAVPGSTVVLPAGNYEFNWAPGSNYQIEKSITVVGDSNGDTNIIVPQGAGFGFRFNNTDPNNTMKVTLKNLNLTGNGAKREGIYVKGNTIADLYNVNVEGFWADILLDNGNMYGNEFVGGTTTTVNAYNVKAKNVQLNATPNTNGEDYKTAPVGYARFNYDGASDIKYWSKQDCAMDAGNLYVNGVCINPAEVQTIAVNPENINAQLAAKVDTNSATKTEVLLQPGTYENITLPQGGNNVVIKPADSTVVIENIQLNSSKNVVIDGVIFDAADAMPVYNKDNKLQGYANITSAKGGAHSGTEGIIIQNCKFVGTPDNVNEYVPILYAEKGRPSFFATDVTIKNCVFECNALQYIKMDYVRGNVVIENNTFGGAGYHTTHNTINATNNNAHWTIKNNKFYNWNPENCAFGTSNGKNEPVFTFNIEGNTFSNQALAADGGIVNFKTSYTDGNYTVTHSDNTFVGGLSQYTESNFITNK